MTPEQLHPMTHEQLQALLTQAHEELNKGTYNQAEELANEVLAQLEEAHANPPQKGGFTDSDSYPSGDGRDVVQLRTNTTLLLGGVSWRRGDYPKALEYYNSALLLSEEIADKEGIAKALGNIGNVNAKLSDYSKALEFFGKALSIDEELGNKAGVSRHLGNIGNVNTELCDYPKALEYLGKALTTDEELGNKEGVARHLGNIGNVHTNLSDYPKALEYLGKALTIDEELGNKAGVALWLGNIGNVYANLSDYPKALEYSGNALAINEELGNKAGVASNLGSIGLLHAELSDYLTALKYYVKALSIYEEIGDKRGVAINLGNIGEAYMHTANHDLALEYFNKALHLSEEIGAAYPRLHWLLGLGQLHTKSKELSNDGFGETYLKQAIEDSTALGVKHITRDASEALYLFYKGEARWQEALGMKELHEKLSSEINIEEVKKQESIREQRKTIELAKAAADAKMSATTSLLHRVLPQSIAARILEGEEEIADYFPTVSILFADIKGFTVISADMPAYIVVRFLKFIFGEFDRIMLKHGCEKIKTIGDGYMAVAGAPITCEDHAERITQAALEMQETIHLPEEIREHFPDGAKLGVRIGIHTGPVVAGVVGADRFVYDIYSDAVNLASRMESHGEVNRIHVSSDFARHLQNRFMMTKNITHGITFEKRGEMEIKGKGIMKTYFLEKA